jgi:hypothetical protein
LPLEKQSHQAPRGPHQHHDRGNDQFVVDESDDDDSDDDGVGVGDGKQKEKGAAGASNSSSCGRGSEKHAMSKKRRDDSAKAGEQPSSKGAATSRHHGQPSRVPPSEEEGTVDDDNVSPEIDIDEEQEIEQLQKAREYQLYRPLLPEIMENVRVWLQNMPVAERPPTRRQLEAELAANSTTLLRSKRKFKALKLLEPLLQTKLLTLDQDGDSLTWDLDTLKKKRKDPKLRAEVARLPRAPPGILLLLWILFGATPPAAPASSTPAPPAASKNETSDSEEFAHLPLSLKRLKEIIKNQFSECLIDVPVRLAFQHLLSTEMLKYQYPLDPHSDRDSSESEDDGYLSDDLLDFPLLYDEARLRGEHPRSAWGPVIVSWIFLLMLVGSFFLALYDKFERYFGLPSNNPPSG